MMTVTVIGDAFIDIIVSIHEIKSGGTYQRAINIYCGCAANVSVWISRLGKRANFVGMIGADQFGDYFKNDLKKERVKDLTIMSDKHPTGMCLSILDESMVREQ